MSKFWKMQTDGSIQCEACAQNCTMSSSTFGKCCVRACKKGVMFPLAENLFSAVTLEPMNELGLYHFMPHAKGVYVQTLGCSLSCSFCPRYNSALLPLERHIVRGQRHPPALIVQQAEKHKAQCMVFGGGEPAVSFETVYELAGLAITSGMKNVLRTNAYVSHESLMALYRRIHAASITLMSFSENFYSAYCGGHLQPVLDSIKTMRVLGWWLEVHTPIISGLNDSKDELTEMARFIRNELGADTPWHLERFRPVYKLTSRDETPTSRMEECVELGKTEGLSYVYFDERHKKMMCPACGKAVPSISLFERGVCSSCGNTIAGVWR